MQVIGLTGGIATGKSTVAQILRSRGVPVVDADHAARAILEPGRPELRAVTNAFGPEVLTEDGHLNRAAVRALIATDPDARARLNAITHPAIRRWIGERLGRYDAAGHPAAVVEAALLVETGSHHLYPTLVVVTCRADTQLARLMARDAQTAGQARAMIAAQLPLADKEAVATHVIHNDGDLQALEARVAEVWADIVSSGPGS